MQKLNNIVLCVHVEEEVNKNKKSYERAMFELSEVLLAAHEFLPHAHAHMYRITYWLRSSGGQVD